jgi:hypothetical protein
MEAMLSKGTPSIATSPSIISGSNTYGALQNVDMPVCGSAAAWRAIVMEAPHFDEVDPLKAYMVHPESTLTRL